MKRIFTFLLGLLLALSAAAQAQITTRKEKISDFGSKTLKIALPGISPLDDALRSAAKDAWYLSPYEICTAAEFERLRTSDNYYFLWVSGSEGPLAWLVLSKGTAAVKEPTELYEIGRFPLCAAGVPSGREQALLPALMEALQTYVQTAQGNDLKRLGSAIGSLKKTRGQDIYLVSGEISPEDSPAYLDKRLDSGIHLVDAATADNALLYGSDAVVAFSIRPAAPVKGDEYYTYFIDARTREIRWFKRYKASGPDGPGLMKADLSALAGSR